MSLKCLYYRQDRIQRHTTMEFLNFRMESEVEIMREARSESN
jgi:hypothetical protein